MSPMLKYFAWMYLRALLWVALVSFGLFRATRNAKVSKSFVAAHLVALGFGAATDFFMLNLAPKSWLQLDVMQWVFVLPIAIFTVISLWIGNREKPIVVPDVFMTLTPVVMWALMVIYGWQSMWWCHVLGAWFVSAAGGAVDLTSRCGPPWSARRPYLTRFSGYVLVVMTVYLILPRTELP
jgi:hypothetical protein